MATYDASYGGGDVIGDSNRVTRAWIHVVMDKQETTNVQPRPRLHRHHRASGGADQRQRRVHPANQDAVDARCVHAGSYGCINLSAQDAEAYIETAFYDDPVEVNRHRHATVPADGDIYSWAIPSDQPRGSGLSRHRR